MKTLSRHKALERLKKAKAEFKSKISQEYEQKAKSCLTCETPGACCLDAHFVNVHISRLEAVAINAVIDGLPEISRFAVNTRIDNSIEDYELSAAGDTSTRTYACPLFEKGIGCLVHDQGKPIPCIMHGCYANETDLPPDELADERAVLVDHLNERTFVKREVWLPLPVAITRERSRKAPGPSW